MKTKSINRKYIVLVSIITFTLFVIIMFPKIETLSGMFNIIPLIIIAYYYDRKGGLIGGLLAFPYVVLIYNIFFDISISLQISPEGLMVTFIETFLGIVVGELSYLRKKLKSEILERKEIEEKLFYYANIDELTNVLNRRAGLKKLEKEISYVQENSFIDLSIVLLMLMV